MDERKQSPIFTRTSDFILWLLSHTEKFSKSERFRMAKRLEDSVFSFLRIVDRSQHVLQKKAPTSHSG